MRPIWFKNASEMQCLVKEMSNWTLNWNYWTGGKQSCSDQWTWCSVQGPEPLAMGLRWADGQPDNFQGDEECLHMRIYKNISGLVISDRKCSNKYVLACQVRTRFFEARSAVDREFYKILHKMDIEFNSNREAQIQYDLY